MHERVDLKRPFTGDGMARAASVRPVSQYSRRRVAAFRHHRNLGEFVGNSGLVAITAPGLIELTARRPKAGKR